MDITYPRVPAVRTETGERKRRETRAAAKPRRREDEAQGENVRHNPKFATFRVEKFCRRHDYAAVNKNVNVTIRLKRSLKASCMQS